MRRQMLDPQRRVKLKLIVEILQEAKKIVNSGGGDILFTPEASLSWVTGKQPDGSFYHYWRDNVTGEKATPERILEYKERKDEV